MQEGDISEIARRIEEGRKKKDNLEYGYVSRVPRDADVDDDKASSSANTNLVAMEKLIKSYEEYDPSAKCFLDGRYFNKVLRGYSGLVSRPLIIHIKLDNKSKTDQEGYEWERTFKIDADQTPVPLRLSQDDPELIRVIIEVERTDPTHKHKDPEKPKKTRHSNLIIIDSFSKKIMRFEPLIEHKYKNILNEFMERYFKRYLPDYEYMEIDLHPQSIDKNDDDLECHNKGMCVAYVTKLAALVALDMDPLFPTEVDDAEEDIRRFSAAIEDQFGPLTEGVPDIEYGLTRRQSRTAVGAATGAVLGGLALGTFSGALLGAAAGGAIGYYTAPYYSPGYYAPPHYDPYYSAPYYSAPYYYQPPVYYSRPYYRPHHSHHRGGGRRGRRH